MKRRSSFAICAMLSQALCGMALADGPIDGKVYGKLNTSLLVEKNLGTRNTHLTNNYSYFGLKGKTKLEDGMVVLYRLEYQVAPDEAGVSSSSIFAQRDSYVGLKTAFGTVVAGTSSTPLRKVQGKIDQFNFLPLGDIKYLIDGEVRIHNVIFYTSPTFKKMQVRLATQANEANQGSNGSSASFTYKGKSLYLAAGADRRIGKIGEQKDEARLAVQYRLKTLALGAILNRSRLTGSSNAKNGWLVSGAYSMGKITLKAQLGHSDEISMGHKYVAVGADYSFVKKTRLYTYLAAHDDNAHDRASVVGFGLEHKF